MAQEEKTKIWLSLADVAPIALYSTPGEEASYRQAEDLLNKTWQKWSRQFANTASAHEVLARVAYSFALRYQQAYGENDAADRELELLEQELDKFVVNG